MNWEDELGKVRTGVESEVFKHEECPAYTPAEGGILGKITQFTPDSPIPHIALGEVGQKLCAFARAVDRSHPGLADVLNGAFMPGHEFCETADQLFQAAKLCNEAGLMRIIPHFAKIGTKLAVHEDLAREIDNPSRTLNFVRFVPLRADRDDLRARQRHQEVNLAQIVQQGPVIWDPLPSSFSLYVRNKHPYSDDIERCKKRAAYLIENGAPEMAGKITSRIASFEDQLKDRYYGFNRVTVVNAAVICAKVMKFDLHASGVGKSHRITVSTDFTAEVRDKAGMTLQGNINGGKGPGTINYEPHLYPIHNFAEQMTDNARKLIDHLEAFPATGGRPIFDHFWVLVPSVNLAHVPTGDIVKDKLLTEGAVKFDAKLVETKVVVPIMLGEKDGRMYFLDYMG